MKQLKKEIRAFKDKVKAYLTKTHNYDNKITFWVGLFIITLTIYTIKDIKDDWTLKCMEQHNSKTICELK